MVVAVVQGQQDKEAFSQTVLQNQGQLATIHVEIYVIIFQIGRLYFTTLRAKPSKLSGYHFFCVDDEFVYEK
jgi:hypothetical protein